MEVVDGEKNWADLGQHPQRPEHPRGNGPLIRASALRFRPEQRGVHRAALGRGQPCQVVLLDAGHQIGQADVGELPFRLRGAGWQNTAGPDFRDGEPRLPQGALPHPGLALDDQRGRTACQVSEELLDGRELFLSADDLVVRAKHPQASVQPGSPVNGG